MYGVSIMIQNCPDQTPPPLPKQKQLNILIISLTPLSLPSNFYSVLILSIDLNYTSVIINNRSQQKVSKVYFLIGSVNI